MTNFAYLINRSFGSICSYLNVTADVKLKFAHIAKILDCEAVCDSVVYNSVSLDKWLPSFSNAMPHLLFLALKWATMLYNSII